MAKNEITSARREVRKLRNEVRRLNKLVRDHDEVRVNLSHRSTALGARVSDLEQDDRRHRRMRVEEWNRARLSGDRNVDLEVRLDRAHTALVDLLLKDRDEQYEADKAAASNETPRESVGSAPEEFRER